MHGDPAPLEARLAVIVPAALALAPEGVASGWARLYGPSNPLRLSAPDDDGWCSLTLDGDLVMKLNVELLAPGAEWGRVRLVVDGAEREAELAPDEPWTQ